MGHLILGIDSSKSAKVLYTSTPLFIPMAYGDLTMKPCGHMIVKSPTHPSGGGGANIDRSI